MGVEGGSSRALEQLRAMDSGGEQGEEEQDEGQQGEKEGLVDPTLITWDMHWLQPSSPHYQVQ